MRGLLTTSRSALELRVGGQIPDVYPVLTWFVRHVACLHHRSHVGPNVRPPWDRAAGRISKMAGAEAGEKVTFLTTEPRQQRQSSFGRWLGFVIGTHEV